MADRPVLPEVEITPEMIDAGADVLGCFDWELDNTRQTVREIFIAMSRVCSERRDPDLPRL